MKKRFLALFLPILMLLSAVSAVSLSASSASSASDDIFASYNAQSPPPTPTPTPSSTPAAAYNPPPIATPVPSPRREAPPPIPEAPPPDIRVIVNGRVLDFDSPPFIDADSGRTLVPLAAIFEAMGVEISWDGETQTITAVRGDITVRLSVGADVLDRNGELIALDVPMQLIDGRNFVPVAAVAQSFGADVSWDEEMRAVIIVEIAISE